MEGIIENETKIGKAASASKPATHARAERKSRKTELKDKVSKSRSDKDEDSSMTPGAHSVAGIKDDEESRAESSLSSSSALARKQASQARADERSSEKKKESQHKISSSSSSTLKKVGEDAEEEDIDMEDTPGAYGVVGLGGNTAYESIAVPPKGEDEESPPEPVENSTTVNKSGRFMVEALLVDDDKKEVSESERKIIEEETRAKILGELGTITTAEVVTESKDDENDDLVSTRKTWMTCAIVGFVVIFAVVLGIVFGREDNKANSTTLTAPESSSPVNSPPSPSLVNSPPSPSLVNSPPSPAPSSEQTTTDFPALYTVCNARKVLKVGEHLESASLEDFGFSIPTMAPNASPVSSAPTVLSLVPTITYYDPDSLSETYVEKFSCFNAANPLNPFLCFTEGGVQFYYRGVGIPVMAQLSSSSGPSFLQDECFSSLQVYVLGSNLEYCIFNCISENVLYPVGNVVSWIAEKNVEYLIQVSGLYFGLEFDLQLEFNGDWEHAYGPFTPSVNTILPGSLLRVESTSPQLPRCGTASAADSGPMNFYAVRGNGKFISASTCGLAPGWDTQISVFSLEEIFNPEEPDDPIITWNCITGDDNYCGMQSRVVWQSEEFEIYYVVVHGSSGSAGDFSLQLGTEGASVLVGDDCVTAITIELDEPQLVPLVSATVDNDIKAVCSSSEFGGELWFSPAGIWYKVMGTGQVLVVTLECSSSCDDTFVHFLKRTSASGGCSALECLDEFWAPNCDTLNPCDLATEVDVEYYVVVSFDALSGSGDPGETIGLTISLAISS